MIASLIAALSVPCTASAEDPALVVEFGGSGQICLGEDDKQALAKRVGEMVVPQSAAITIVAYSSRDERSKKRGIKAKCVTRVVPNGIQADQRLAVLRALHVSDLAQELGLEAFKSTPLLLIGAGAGYRQTDPAGIAIVARRSQGSGEADRRVEIYVTEGRSNGGGANYGSVMAPVLLPPMAYGGGAAPAVPGDPTPTATAVATSAPGAQELLGWTFLGLGLTAVVGGGVSYQQSLGLTDRADEVAFDRRQQDAYRDSADLYEQVAFWSGGLGIGLATLGIILVATSEDEETTVTIAPAPFGDGAIVQFGSNLPAWSWQ